MNWKNIVEKQNASLYRWPAGWDTREQVAAQLECSPDRVSTILAPGIKDGSIEVKAFPVWDKVMKRTTKVMGYRQRPERETATAPKSTDVHFAILDTAKRFPHLSPSKLRRYLPRAFRGTSAEEISEILNGE